jgi:ubiquinone/menaquinone biosynthesis C-methylase UbiE
MPVQDKIDESEDIRTHVRERYGRIAAETGPNQTASCCGPTDGVSDCCGPETAVNLDQVIMLYEAPDVTDLPSEVTGLSLGCGDPVTLASLQPGQTVIDLGSGGGIDCFLAAKRVGDKGRVIGVDMTAEMIEKARSNKVKVGTENVEFRLGEIEHLPVADGTADVVISNCVINLSPDKKQVFREAYRVLRPGGRLAVSDIVTDGSLPEDVKSSPSAWATCIAGALDVKDYVAAIEAAGFLEVEITPVYMDKSTIDEAVEQLELGEVVGNGNDSLYKSVFSAKVSAYKPK